MSPETVYLAIAPHQWEAAAVFVAIVCFTLGWSIFGWSR